MGNDPPRASSDSRAIPLPRFNLATMSGVQTGSRTAQFFRIRLASASARDGWALLLVAADGGAALRLWQPEGDRGGAWQDKPFWAEEPAGEHTAEQASGPDLAQLSAACAGAGWTPRTCGTCAFWAGRAEEDQPGLLAVGDCRAGAASPELRPQSALGLDCAHWQAAGTGADAEPPPVNAPTGTFAERPPGGEPSPEEPAPAEGWLARLAARLTGRTRRPGSDSPGADVQERSGVGAGTEACLICHGRMGNLGALSVAAAEGDTRTFSLWRCRVCQTLFLNDWTDRWERLNSLETEELYFRLAPAQASRFLEISQTEPGSEHPARRGARAAQREQVLALLDGLRPVSHQVRHGR